MYTVWIECLIWKFANTARRKSMPKPKNFPPSEAVTEGALINRDEYNWMYRQSVKDPEGFWGAHGKRIDWIRPYTEVKNTSYGSGEVSIRWFYDGTLNVSANCVDRHAEKTPDKIAIIWEGDDPAEDRKFTYAELKSEVCRMANVLKSLGVRRGDRVTIYMPMIPEVAFAMLACARIGAIHSVVFGGFSPQALGGRISDCESEIVIRRTRGFAALAGCLLR